jgi:hypothetical protein
MDVRTYLFTYRMKVIHTAKQLKITPQHLSLICNGKQIPSLKLAEKLIKMGKGDITPEDIYPQLFQAYKKSCKGKSA